MSRRILKSDLILILVAAVWGFAFVAQRAGMEHVGPFTYNTLRFAIGGLTLLPFIYFNDKRNPGGRIKISIKDPKSRLLLRAGLLAGIVIFIGASLQQAGLVFTTAGKAGFITGLYVIFVPAFGLLLKRPVGFPTWIGAILAAVGLYFLSIRGSLAINPGDILVFACSWAWAGHVLLIAHYSPRVDPIKLACLQFTLAAVLSMVAMLLFETPSLYRIWLAGIPILYGGFISAGIGFTLQVVAQRDAHPAHAAIIMSLEAVFAVFGGWLILHEVLDGQGIIGCVLMLVGMLLSQMYRPDFNVQGKQVDRTTTQV
jgi:drug/metabolite transporter (DMT)-like permease